MNKRTPSRIAIRYGQPHARGRKIEGGLIPLDTVWRFGANEATTLHSDVDFTLGQLAIPRGDYTLFVVDDRGVPSVAKHVRVVKSDDEDKSGKRGHVE